MKMIIPTVLCVAALGLAACQDAGRFGDTSGNGGAGATDALAGGGAGGSAAPGTAAYFNTTIGDRVLFAVDQSTLSDAAKQTLNAQAAWLTDNPEFTAIVEGHADEQGTREYNLALGARRAAAAESYLVSQGVPPGRLRTVTYGKERPVEICSSETCYAKNRRAVTVVAAGAGV